MHIMILKAYKTQNNIITNVLKKIISILQLDAAWQNEFRFDLLVIKFAFYVPQYLKQRDKKLNQIYLPTISNKHIQPKCTCINSVILCDIATNCIVSASEPFSQKQT